MDLNDINLNEIKNLENFSGIIPLFPLSSVVFFPNTLLPLHIFETRYKKMLEDALNTEKMIGMVLLKPGWENDYYGNPQIFNIAGMGRIVTSETLDDGKSNIILYGLERIQILDILDEVPYRKAKIKILENESGNSNDSLKNHIIYLVETWNDMIGKKNSKHQINISNLISLAELTDVLSSILITNVFEKQKMLEELNVEQRAKEMISFIETRLKIFSLTSRKKDEILQTRSLN